MATVKQNPMLTESANAYRNAIHATARTAGVRLTNVTVDLVNAIGYATDASGYKYRVKLKPKSVGAFRSWDAVGKNPKAQQYEAYCLQCLGGGKTLKTGTKRECEREATSHSNMYGHKVTVMPKNPALTKEQRCRKLLAESARKSERPTITYAWKNGTVKNGKVLRTYTTPEGKTMTWVLAQIGKDYKVGDVIEIWYKDRKYTWEKYARTAWRKLIVNPAKNPTRRYRVIVKFKGDKPAAFEYADAESAKKYARESGAEKATVTDKETGRVIFTSGARKKNFSNADFRRFTKDRLLELSKMFQGEASGARIRVQAPDTMPANTFRLGYLRKLIFKDRNGVKQNVVFDGNAYVSGDLRCNLWFSGKDARIENFDLPRKPHIAVLGDLVQVEYVTAKRHIEGGRTVRFWHPLGEVTREYPKLGIDYDGFPLALGGGYDIWNVGIVN